MLNGDITRRPLNPSSNHLDSSNNRSSTIPSHEPRANGLFSSILKTVAAITNYITPGQTQNINHNMRSVAVSNSSLSSATWILYEGEYPACCGDFSYSSPSPAVAYVADGTGHNYQGIYRNTRTKMAETWASFNHGLAQSNTMDNVNDMEELFTGCIKQLSTDFENIGKSSTLSFAWFVDTRSGSELRTINLGDSVIFHRNREGWQHIQGHNDETSDNEIPYDTFYFEPKIVKTTINENDVVIGLTDGVVEALVGMKGSISSITNKLNEIIGDATEANEIKEALKSYTYQNIPDENADDCSCFVMVR